MPEFINLHGDRFVMDQMQIIFYLFFVYDDLHAVDFKCIVLHKEKITAALTKRSALHTWIRATTTIPTAIAASRLL